MHKKFCACRSTAIRLGDQTDIFACLPPSGVRSNQLSELFYLDYFAMMAEEPCKDTGATNGQELDHRLKTIENSIGVIQQGLASILQAQINGRRAAKAAKYTRPSTRMQL